MSWRLAPDDCVLLVVDAQEKLLPAIHEHAALEKKLAQLVAGLGLLGVPVVFTEQYPKGLGKTLGELTKLAPGAIILEKTTFSAVPWVLPHLSRKHVLVVGMETHICVRQTVYDLRRSDKKVTVIGDATGSRQTFDRDLALAEMRADEILIYGVEALLFELMADAAHPAFKKISELIK
jgi:nicotinamidase-related amidase